MTHWKEMTNADALAAWDNGDPVWTVEMGGMGPGYEQAIHVMAMEMLRAMASNPFDFATFESAEECEQKALWGDYRKRIEDEPAVAAVIEKITPSGAQFGAAMNIATVFSRNGYAKGIDMAPEDRRIMISKNFSSL